MSSEELMRRVDFSPAFDRRDPAPSKNYGIGAVQITFHLIGPQGSVQWMIGTDWYPAHVQQEQAGTPPIDRVQPTAWDLGYHSREPMYEGQEPQTDDCPIIGGRCFYDGSGLNAERLIAPFLAEGSDAVWRELEAYFADVFSARKQGGAK